MGVKIQGRLLYHPENRSVAESIVFKLLQAHSVPHVEKNDSGIKVAVLT